MVVYPAAADSLRGRPLRNATSVDPNPQGGRGINEVIPETCGGRRAGIGRKHLISQEDGLKTSNLKTGNACFQTTFVLQWFGDKTVAANGLCGCLATWWERNRNVRRSSGIKFRFRTRRRSRRRKIVGKATPYWFKVNPLYRIRHTHEQRSSETMFQVFRRPCFSERNQPPHAPQQPLSLWPPRFSLLTTGSSTSSDCLFVFGQA